MLDGFIIVQQDAALATTCTTIGCDHRGISLVNGLLYCGTCAWHARTVRLLDGAR